MFGIRLEQTKERQQEEEDFRMSNSTQCHQNAPESPLFIIHLNSVGGKHIVKLLYISTETVSVWLHLTLGPLKSGFEFPPSPPMHAKFKAS